MLPNLDFSSCRYLQLVAHANWILEQAGPVSVLQVNSMQI